MLLKKLYGLANSTFSVPLAMQESRLRIQIPVLSKELELPTDSLQAGLCEYYTMHGSKWGLERSAF